MPARTSAETPPTNTRLGERIFRLNIAKFSSLVPTPTAIAVPSYLFRLENVCIDMRQFFSASTFAAFPRERFPRWCGATCGVHSDSDHSGSFELASAARSICQERGPSSRDGFVERPGIKTGGIRCSPACEIKKPGGSLRRGFFRPGPLRSARLRGRKPQTE